MEVSNEKRWLTVTDHSVSGESFTLYHDTELDLLATHPQPNPDALPAYYESPNYISHTDSKRSLFEKMYHFVKQLSLKRKVKLINRLNKKGMLLDVGAGTGDFLLKASQDGWQATGIEPSNKARRIAEEKGCRFVESSAMLPGASFDVITMWHVLEHVPDPVAQLQELSRLLKPTGTIIIAVPNFRSF